MNKSHPPNEPITVFVALEYSQVGQPKNDAPFLINGSIPKYPFGYFSDVEHFKKLHGSLLIISFPDAKTKPSLP